METEQLPWSANYEHMNLSFHYPIKKEASVLESGAVLGWGSFSNLGGNVKGGFFFFLSGLNKRCGLSSGVH